MIIKFVPEITDINFFIEDLICPPPLFQLCFHWSKDHDARHKLFTKSKMLSPQSLRPAKMRSLCTLKDQASNIDNGRKPLIVIKS